MSKTTPEGEMDKELDFLDFVSRLKHLDRTGWVQSGIKKPESVAGHMYRMAVMSAFILDDPTIDANKCIKMSLVHDMGESIIGDITPHDNVDSLTKATLEVAAIERLSGLISKNKGDEMQSLFKEYEDCQTAEAKVVKDFDRFDMILQAYEYERLENKPKFLQEFFDSTQGFFKDSHPKVKELILNMKGPTSLTSSPLLPLTSDVKSVNHVETILPSCTSQPYLYDSRSRSVVKKSTSNIFPFWNVQAASTNSSSSDIAFISSKKSLAKAKEPLRLFAHVRMEHLVAGMSGGVASTLILHPLDLVKIRFAVNDGLGSRPKYDGLFHAFKSILKDEGVRGLYRGVTPNVWGAGSAWGLYFLFYNSLKTWWQGGDTKTDLGPARHMALAAEAGLLTLIVTNPIWVVKTRLCLQYGAPGPTPAVAGGTAVTYYHGMTDALVKVYRMEGIKGLYRGFVPGMFGVSHGAIQFMTYEEMKTAYNKYRNVPIDAKLGTSEYLAFAAVSKLIAAGSTYPYQVVRARLQDQHRSYDGVMDVMRQTWRNEGVRGFYKGMVPNIIRVVPACAITFVVYEHTAGFLSAYRSPPKTSDTP